MHSSNISPFSYVSLTRFSKYFWEGGKKKKENETCKAILQQMVEQGKHLTVTNYFLLRVLPSSSGTFQNHPVSSLRGQISWRSPLSYGKWSELWKEVQAFCPSHIYAEPCRCKQEPLTQEELLPLQTLSDCQSGNSATRAIKVDVKDQGQGSNFLF